MMGWNQQLHGLPTITSGIRAKNQHRACSQPTKTLGKRYTLKITDYSAYEHVKYSGGLTTCRQARNTPCTLGPHANVGLRRE